MMEPRKVIPGEATGAAAMARSLPTIETAREGYRRLSILAAVMLGAMLVGTVVWAIETTATGSDRSFLQSAGDVAVVVFLVVIVVGCRRSLFPARVFVPVAVAVEVVVAFGLSAPIYGWQHRLGADAIAWLVNNGPAPFGLGVALIPVVGVWIILFTTIIPMRPSQHLLGAVLSVAPMAVWPFVSVWALGMPEPLSKGSVVYTTHVAAWLAFRGAMAAGIAYFAARSVHGLRRRLAAARQMGSYQLRELLGRGGMGEVWRAEHAMLARSAAIKLIRTDGGGSGSTPDVLAERFRREVRAAAQLRSPRTIEVYDYGLTEDGTFYYVMELLDGLDLNELVEKHGPLPWRRAVCLLRQVCDSLGEAHSVGLVHRDIKPANIFVCRVGRDADQIKVLDFGLVKATSDRSAPTLTQEGSFVGTPAFAAPEMATESADAAVAASDIYSLGCVAYWLLTACTVFEASTPVEMLIKHAQDAPRPPSELAEIEVPCELDRIILRCLAKEPSERPTSVDALAHALREVEGSESWGGPEADKWWAQHRPAPASVVHV